MLTHTNSSEPAATRRAQAQPGERRHKWTRPCRILIADDDPLSREMLGTYFALEGHEILTAADGIEALAAARRFQPDVICTDICMPQMDGLALGESLRRDADTRDIVLVAVTAIASDRHTALASLGFDAFFAKPVDLEALGKSIERLTGC